MSHAAATSVHEAAVSVRQMTDIPTVSVALWRPDAVVLYGWLMSVDLNSVPVTHPAQKQALMDLLTRLESETDLPCVTREHIDLAQAAVARDLGW